MYRLAQIVARRGEKTRIRLIRRFQIARAFRNSAFEVRVRSLELRAHMIELLCELFELVTGGHVNAVREITGPDFLRA